MSIVQFGVTYSFISHVLNRENVNNSLIMVQPTLTSYSLDAAPQPVLLDSISIRPEVILMLDSYFHIVIFHGEHIAMWRDQGYHMKPEFANLKMLLEAPPQDAKDLLADRYPIPMYVVCDQHGSQSRFLISKLNPSTTHVNSATTYGGQAAGQAQGQAIFTDDVSLQVFLDHLKKLVVAATQ
jgi:protein transport protein SEC23